MAKWIALTNRTQAEAQNVFVWWGLPSCAAAITLRRLCPISLLVQGEMDPDLQDEAESSPASLHIHENLMARYNRTHWKSKSHKLQNPTFHSPWLSFANVLSNVLAQKETVKKGPTQECCFVCSHWKQWFTPALAKIKHNCEQKLKLAQITSCILVRRSFWSSHNFFFLSVLHSFKKKHPFI